MKQKQATQNQYQSVKQSQSLNKKNREFLPSCTISTILHLNAPDKEVQNQDESHRAGLSKNTEKYYPSPNIQLNHLKPNKMVFHHYQKFNTFQFQFDQIFQHYTKNIHFSNSINLYQSIIEQTQDVLLMAMGGYQSGLTSLCQGNEATQHQGLFFSMISQLWNRLKAEKQKNTNVGINSVKITLKFIAISDEKIYDILFPKNEVHLKDSNNRFSISGCGTYEIKTLYDFYQKLLQVYEQKRLLYPQCIMVSQAEITISKESHFITDQEVAHRCFTFIQWEKGSALSGSVKPKQNNNKSLLTLNMCIYQLYKISCHPPEKLTQYELKKLWSIFRNSFLTMIMKNYFMGNGKIVFVSCISLKEHEEQQNYQILMVGKNLAKIDFKECRAIYNKPIIKLKFQKHDVANKKMKTEPIETDCSFQRSSNSAYLQKIKQNLKKILKQKSSSEQIKEKNEQIITLFKEQKQKKKELENIRYKKEQIKVIEDYSRVNKANSFNNSKIFQNNDSKITLPTIHLKKPSRQLELEQLQSLSKEQEKTIKQIDSIHQKILSNLQEQSNQHLTKNAIEMQIKLQQKQMIEFINHKNKILSLLKQQVNSIKIEEERANQGNKVTKVTASTKRRIKSRNDSLYHTLQTKEESQKEENPERQTEERAEEESMQPGIFKMQNLKKMNKNNYLFEKRRMILKAKVSKGRAEVNQFYEEAAKKFQDYRSK